MNANRKKFSRALIPLTLAVFGLALVLLVLGLFKLPVTPVSADPGAKLAVTVTLSESDLCYDENVQVTATIKNEGDMVAKDVTGTIAWDPDSALAYVNGPTPSFGDGVDIGSGDTYEVVWELKCSNSGTAVITVTAHSPDLPDASDSKPITQSAAVLDVGLAVSDDEVCVGNRFTVTVPVTNTGNISVANAYPELDSMTEATCDPLVSVSQTITNGMQVTFTTVCTCNARTTAVISLTQMSGDPVGDCNTMKVSLPSPVNVTQKEAVLKASLETSKQTVQQGDSFVVTAWVTNTGNTNANNVTPTLSVDGPASCPDPTPLAILVPGPYGFAAQCICTGAGVVTITAAVTGTDACSGGTITTTASAINVTQTPILAPAVEILRPITGEHVVKSQWFTLTANVHGDPGDRIRASVEISPDDSVDAVRPDPPEQTVTIDNEEGKKPVEWRLHCGKINYTTTITVTAALLAEDDTPVVTGTAAITVVQYPGHPKLKATIVKPREEKFYESETFSVMALISNTGGELAQDVWAEIDLDGPAVLVEGESDRKYLGHIPGWLTEPQYGNAHEVMWTVHCTGPGQAIITVTPEGTDDVTGDPIADITPGYKTVNQVPREQLELLNLRPQLISGALTTDLEKVGTSSIYSITVLITNTGYADLVDVVATIDWDGHVTWEAGGDDEVQGYPITTTNLIQHGSREVSWRFHCSQGADNMAEEDEYRVPFTVVAVGKSELCDVVTATDTITIVQKDLVVDISHPLEGYKVNTSEHFVVTATVTNRYVETLNPITATIEFDPPGSASTTGATQNIGPIDKLETVTVTWDVTCVQTGTTTIRVRAGGKSTPSSDWIDNEDDVVVIQQAKAHLVAHIDSPEAEKWYAYSNEIPLQVAVTNTGEATATGVKAVITIVGEASRLSDSATTFTLTVGPLAEGQSGTVADTLHCDGPCTVTITADPVGTDVNTGVGIIEANTDEDTVTIHQMPFRVTIVQFPNEVETGATFGIHAVISNTWNDECGDCGEVGPFTATINILEGAAELAYGENASKQVTAIPLGQGHEVEWTLKCYARGVVKVSVTAVTSINPQTGLPLGYEVSSTSDFVAIWQNPRQKGYEIQLCKDWNYMSLPVIPVSHEITKVLEAHLGVVDEVYAYDAENDKWLAYFPGADASMYAGLDMLTEMEDGVGYIMQMIYPALLLGEGYEDPPNPVTPPREYPLEKGWNLVGFKTRDFDDTECYIDATDVMTAGHYLKNLGRGCVECDKIIGDRARFFRRWECGYPGGWEVLYDADCMTVGGGYWLYATEDDLSIVPPLDRPSGCTG